MNIFALFTKKPSPNEAVTKLTLKLDGMHCASCSLLIDDTLEEIDGVLTAKTSYRHGKTVVTFDPQQVDQEKIQSALIELGYRVKS